ncbi:hypothetical protein GP486_008274, partial [Trichoglossum hirsutum]
MSCDKFSDGAIVAELKLCDVGRSREEHASLASTMTTLKPADSARYLAQKAPVIPLPMMTTWADEGSSGVLRWWRRKGDGERCQKECVELEDGRLAGLPEMEGMGS